MVKYIFLDTNNWIYLSNGFNALSNKYDELHLKIFEIIKKKVDDSELIFLVNDIIIEEWERNRSTATNQVRDIEKKTKSYQDQLHAIDVYAGGGLNEIKKIQQRLDKATEFKKATLTEHAKQVEYFLLNQTVSIDIPNEVKIEAADMAAQKKAPFIGDKKNSMSDALILLSSISYLSEISKVDPSTSEKECQFPESFFVSSNKGDFSAPNNKEEIHPDLKPVLHETNTKFYYTLSQLIKSLGYDLTDEEEAEIDNFDTDYLDNLKHLDMVISKWTKNAFDEEIVISLFSKNNNYKQYFFKNLDKAIWFNFLKEEGFFEPENNPGPIEIKNRFEIPYWEPLTYLEKLSLRIKEGFELEYIDDLLDVIKNVSENPKDNYRTWYMFLKILSNIPNDRITIETLNYIPIWITSKFDTNLQSSELCESLLPKFLSERPTKGDIEKAEIILTSLFSLEKKENNYKNQSKVSNGNYVAKVYLYYLQRALIDNNGIEKVAKYCSNRVIKEIENSIQKVLYDFPSGINFPILDGEKEYDITVFFDTSLSIHIKNNGRKKSYNIEDYTKLDYKEFELKFINILKGHGINYQLPNEEDNEITDVFHFITHGLSSSIKNVFKLYERHNHRNNILNIFVLIYRNLLTEIVRQNIKSGLLILKSILFEKKNNLVLFQKIALYVICENWETTKYIFFKIINEDKRRLFSESELQNELYYLLKNVQNNFSQNESRILDNIIGNGPIDNSYKSYGNVDYWKLRWYSALKDSDFFKNKYLSLSEALNISHEQFENFGKISVAKSEVSPFTEKQIQEKGHKEISEFILSFKPRREWDGVTVDGLGETLEKVALKEPMSFSDEISYYLDAYYIYPYYILNGFRDAWKNKKNFNWSAVLQFCIQYISSDKFYTNKLRINESHWGADYKWVVRSISRLLIEGMHDDKNALDFSLLKYVKEIIIILSGNLVDAEKLIKEETDYPTYLFNSTEGCVLRALFEYSLFRARHTINDKEKIKWELDIRELLENTLNKSVIDGYILIGMYFHQFYYLDSEWITKKISSFYKLESQNWNAFIGGLAFSSPNFSKETYKLFHPHYERAINNNMLPKGFNDYGLIRHIATFYFWGYEKLNDKGLVFRFVNRIAPSSILELVHFISFQDEYFNSLDSEGRKKFEILIINLWKLLSNQFRNPQNEDEEKILATLIDLLPYISELNEDIAKLVKKSCIESNDHPYTYELLKNLNVIKDRGESISTSRNLGEILLTVPFKNYLFSPDEQTMIDLVTFLFENEQVDNAKQICNKLVSLQYDFIRPIYDKFVN